MADALPEFAPIDSSNHSEFTPASTAKKIRSSFVTLLIVIVGVIVAQLVYDTMTNSHRVSDFISAMKSRTSSASKTTTDSKVHVEDAYMKHDPSIPSKLVNLTPCGPNDSSCADIQKVAPETKKKNEQTVLKFLEENADAILMVYAPWCGHCHSAMPHLHKASSQTKIPCALINAELVPEALLAGGPNFDVKYFPHIVRRTKKGKEISVKPFGDEPSEQNLVQFSM